jgi:hypothetical protein
MDLEYCIKQLAEDAQRVGALVDGVNEAQARWKPDPDSWSILEVICHLLDEERYDFRVRLDITLHKTNESWPSIDPAGWVTERGYNEQDLAIALQGYLEEREASLAWLRGLERPDWEAAYKAPWGPITAGDLLASWVAHDLLHMRQLVELHWYYKEEQVAPYSTRYAGEW